MVSNGRFRHLIGFILNFLCIIGITFGAYLLVMLLDFWRIRRIPMDEALKNVE